MTEIPIVLIGHKDHGKSTLIGRLILDTKSIKESRFKEVQEVDESAGQKFELAHLVDSFKEEREREMTMDTTRALLKGEERNYQLIDVPGHAELISNMLTGASDAEAALLMVSIKEGVGEQTRQHLEIAKLLGIEQLGVVVNKMDAVGYQKEAFDKTVEQLKDILTSIGYLPEKIKFFPVSAWEGDNAVKKSENMLWYQGKTVMGFLENEIKEPGSKKSLPEIFIVQDEPFKEGKGIMVLGWVESGQMKAGAKYSVLPPAKEVKVGVIRDSEGDLKIAVSGQNIGVEILENGISESDFKRGTVIVSEKNSLKVDKSLSGEVFWITPPSQRKLIFECGTARVEGELLEPKSINQGEKNPYRIFLKEPVVFEPKGKTILGKIVLKEKGKIIGVGNING